MSGSKGDSGLTARKREPLRRSGSSDLASDRRRAMLIHIVAYGGAFVLAVGLVVAVVVGRSPEEAVPEIPLDLAAKDLARGRRLPEAPVDREGRRDVGEPRVSVDAGGPPGPDVRGADAAVAGEPDSAEPATPGGVIVAAPDEVARPPEQAGATEAGKPDDGCKRYPVLPGDTASGVARRLERGVETMAKWNPKFGETPLKAGELLRVCDGARSIVEWKKRSIVVSAGDTALKIAKEHGLTLANVSEANEIDADRIFVGQKLVVFEPVWE